MEIKFEDVTMFKDKNTAFSKTILDNLSLEFKKGCINAICGGNGKSSIARALLAFESIDSGRVVAGDFIITKKRYIKNIDELRFQIGYLFQNPEEFLYHKTVRAEIEFGMKYYKYRAHDIKKRPLESLKMVGLDESYLEKNPLHLSLSEQKKVMLAAVLAFNPEVIIFDEFEKGLIQSDKKYLKNFLKMLKNKFGKTIIIISNDVNFLIDLCDYLFVINEGTLVLEGNKDLFNDFNLYEYVDMPKIKEFITYLNSTGHKMQEFTDIKELIKAVYRDVQ